MKNLLLVLGIVTISQTIVKADILSTIGTMLSSYNLGSCQAIIENVDNDRDTCYVSCGETSTSITNMFTSATYTN